MNKLFTILLIALAVNAKAQSTDSVIDLQQVTVNEQSMVKKFYVNGNKMNNNQLLLMCEPNADTYNLMLDATEAKFFGKMFCVIGAGLVAYPFVSMIWEDKPIWEVAIGGCCLAAISVPLFHIYNKKSIEAWGTLNGKVPADETSLNISVTNNGVGLCLRF